jgi:hypothetical protein
MFQSIAKRSLPHIGAIVVLFLLSAFFFKPEFFEGKSLLQTDVVQALGAQHEMKTYYDKDGRMPLWTNAMFGGMPSTQIVSSNPNDLTLHVNRLMRLNQDVTVSYALLFCALLSAYIALLVIGANWQTALIGAVGFGMATFHFLLLEAGHMTKMLAIGFVPGVIAGAILVLKKRYLAGGAMMALFVAMQIASNHVQITYYMYIALAEIGLSYVIYSMVNKEFKHGIIAMAIWVAATALGASTNTVRLWMTYEYGAETIRGKSELAANAEKGDGLTKDYAFPWSYSLSEFGTMIIPDFSGRSSSELFFSDQSSASYTAVMDEMKTMQGQPGMNEQMFNQAYQQMAYSTTKYWGGQKSGTSGPLYYGAALMFLFVLGLFYVPVWMRAGVISAMVVLCIIAMGENLKGINYFLFEYFPMFNKFRDMKMSLSIGQALVAITAAWGLSEFFKSTLADKAKKVQLATYIVGGFVLAMIGLSFTFGYNTAELPSGIAAALQADRAAMLRADAFRSLALILACAAVLWLYAKEKLSAVPVWGITAIIALVVLFDSWSVGRRFVTEDQFKDAVDNSWVAAPLEADKAIKAIEGTKVNSYRVLDVYPRMQPEAPQGNPFVNALTSYHHPSLGGYHAAKLGIFQEFIERYLSKMTEYPKLLSMLNAKYIIFKNPSAGQPNQPKSVYQALPGALGNAWFVSDYKLVKNADAELDTLARLEPRWTAIIQEKYAPYLEGMKMQYDSASSIVLSAYHPEKLVYDTKAATEQLAVFSEVYYNPEKGWNVYIDGQKVKPFVRCNYVLRALRVPAGSHKIEMRYEPRSYYTGRTINLAGSAIILALVALSIFLWFKKTDWSEPTPVAQPEVEAPKQAANSKAKRK